MILTVYDHEKTVNIQVPVTPNTTFIDVLRCCKGFTDGNYYITGIFSNKEERVIEPNDRPYEFVRKNGNFKRQFVIYKAEDDNIFLKGSIEHFDKKRFTLSDLVNYVSHHDKIMERHNKTVMTMEERLKRLRSDEMMKRRGDTNLLTLMQGAQLHEKKIDLIRGQRGHIRPQTSKQRSQGTSLEELKVWFRTTDDEMKKLKQRVDGSLQRIRNCKLSESLKPSNETKKLLRELQEPSDLTENTVLGSDICLNKDTKSGGSSCELDVKIRDLRNRLNLDRKPKVVRVQRPAHGIGNTTSRETRSKSATEILLRSGQLSSSNLISVSSCVLSSPSSSCDLNPSPSSSSSSTAVNKNSKDIFQHQPVDKNHGFPTNSKQLVDGQDPLVNSLIGSSQQLLPHTSHEDIHVSTSSSSQQKSDIGCRTIDNQFIIPTSTTHGGSKIQNSFVQQSTVKLRQPNSNMSSSSSSSTSMSSVSHKRRQRAAVCYQLEDTSSAADDIKAIKINPIPPINLPSINVPSIPVKSLVEKPVIKSYFYKVIQRANDDVCSSSSGKNENIKTNCADGTSINVGGEAFPSLIGDVSFERFPLKDVLSLPAGDHSITGADNDTKADADNDLKADAIPIDQAVKGELITSVHNPPSMDDLKTRDDATLIRCSSPSRLTSNLFDVSSPLVQVTPISTTTNNNMEGDSDIFNITNDHNQANFCENSFSHNDLPSTQSFQLQNNSNSLVEDLKPSTSMANDDDVVDDDDGKQTHHHEEAKDDSFFSIPVTSSLLIPGIEDSSEFSEYDAKNHPPVDATSIESFSSYPYPFTEVLEQLDGSASILRNSAGGIRSLRKRLSSDDSHHHHGDIARSSLENKTNLFINVENFHQPIVGTEEIIDDTSFGLRVDFKPKSLTRQYFGGLPQDLAPSVISEEPLNEDLSRHQHENPSHLASKNVLNQESNDKKDTSSRHILPDVICTEVKQKHIMECVVFKDSNGKDNEIIIISPKENSKMLIHEDEEPGIIIAGHDDGMFENNEDNLSSGGDDDSSTTDSNVNNSDDDDDENDSFSPLIDTFCENIKDESEKEELLSLREERIKNLAENKQQGKGQIVDGPRMVSETRATKSILKKPGEDGRIKSRVVFSPLAILLDAALHGELDVVKDIINKHGHADMTNDEGITALHNAICAGHSDVVQFLVNSGCDVNAADSDLWTPLHCAASCYNVSLLQVLVESGACVFATTESEGETALDKCEDEEEDGGRCKKYLEEIQSKMMDEGVELYAAYDSQHAGNPDELHFCEGDVIVVCDPEQKVKDGGVDEDVVISPSSGDDVGEGWCMARSKRTGEQGYIPKNYFSMFPRVSADY